MEAAGIPTVALATMADRVRRVRYPRAAVAKFPRGATCGGPHAVALQRAVVREAFRVLETAEAPGTLVELPHRYEEDCG